MAMKLTKTLCASAAALFCLLSFVSCRQDAAHASGPAAPVDVKVFNRLVAVLGHENRTLELVDPASGEKVKSIRLGQPPNGMALDGSTAYVAEGGPRGVVEVVDLESGGAERFLSGGAYAHGLPCCAEVSCMWRAGLIPVCWKWTPLPGTC